MKICLVGHACSPVRGSDPGVTWNWAWHLSQLHRVWVLTHPAERKAIDEYLAAHPNPNLQFRWVTIPRWLDTWDPEDSNSHVGYRHYFFWQKAALEEARKLHAQFRFDIAHHVSWGTVNIPPPLWRLPVPFVWGPVGGGQTAPRSFLGYFGGAWKSEVVRMARIKMMPLLPALRKAARRASLILAGNPETGLLLKRSGAREVVPFLDTGVREDFLAGTRPEEKPAGKKLTILWVGQLIPRKGFPLAVQALARVRNLPYRLLVAGRGPLQKQMEDLVTRLGLSDRVKFLGFVPFPLMSELYRSADVFLFTSLRDSFGSQILEAMASGLPVITLNHQGAGAFVPEDAAIKVPVTHPQRTISEIARGIERLVVRTEERMQMGRAAMEFARSQTWPRRVQIISALYRGALEDIRKPSLQLANA